MNTKNKQRLNRITTKTGDSGESSLADGVRLNKSDLAFDALGDIDELNVALGILSDKLTTTDELKRCNWIQHKLFNFGGELSHPSSELITNNDVNTLETWLDTYNKELPALKDFVLPNGNLTSITAHQVRVICRRAERSVCKLNNQQKLSVHLLCFINRLSDLFFVLARFLSFIDEKGKGLSFQEEQWNIKNEDEPNV